MISISQAPNHPQKSYWFNEMKLLVEKGTAFGGYSIDLSKDTNPLNKLFPNL